MCCVLCKMCVEARKPPRCHHHLPTYLLFSHCLCYFSRVLGRKYILSHLSTATIYPSLRILIDDKLIDDHLAVQAIIRSYQVIFTQRIWPLTLSSSFVLHPLIFIPRRGCFIVFRLLSEYYGIKLSKPPNPPFSHTHVMCLSPDPSNCFFVPIFSPAAS